MQYFREWFRSVVTSQVKRLPSLPFNHHRFRIVIKFDEITGFSKERRSLHVYTNVYYTLYSVQLSGYVFTLRNVLALPRNRKSVTKTKLRGWRSVVLSLLNNLHRRRFCLSRKIDMYVSCPFVEKLNSKPHHKTYHWKYNENMKCEDNLNLNQIHVLHIKKSATSASCGFFSKYN